MDDKDAELLRLLRANSRESITSLSRKLGIGRATVQDRLNRLVERKTINRFTIVTEAERSKDTISTVIMIKVNLTSRDRIVGQLSSIQELREVHRVTGDYDFLAIVDAPNLVAVDEVIDALLKISGVERTWSALLLKQVL